MKKIFMGMILVGLSFVTAASESYSDRIEVRADSKDMILNLDDEGWSSIIDITGGVVQMYKTIALRLSTIDNKELTDLSKAKLVLFLGKECRDLEEKIHNDQLNGIENTYLKITKVKSYIPPRSLNLINNDMIFGRCLIDFEAVRK